MKIAIVTDAWEPQVNGVVTTLKITQDKLTELGNTVQVFQPNGYKSIPCPTYPEIRLALNPKSDLEKSLGSFAPEAIHIATEGPMGLAARAVCKKKPVGLYHVVPYPVPGIHTQAVPGSFAILLCLFALVSFCGSTHHGPYTAPTGTADIASLRKPDLLALRRGYDRIHTG